MANSSYMQNRFIDPLRSDDETNSPHPLSSSTHNERSFRPSDCLQSVSAPTSPVYLNMAERDRGGGASRETSTDSPSLHPYANYPLLSGTIERHPRHQHHRSHRPQSRNRYPYVPYFERRPKALHGISKNQSHEKFRLKLSFF